MMKQLVGVAVSAAIREGGVYAFSYVEASWVHVDRSQSQSQSTARLAVPARYELECCHLIDLLQSECG